MSDSGDPETDARVGTTVADRYRVDDLLGSGGMGTVYRAEHIRMRKTVALKVLHREMTYLDEVVARFEREAVAAGRIDHPNVAGATDFGRLEDGSFYLVLEYVDGRSLSTVLKDGPLEVDRALSVARQVADALAAAHAHDIVHRDLKPDNVMLVTLEDGSDKVKVLDFGIAKMTAPAGSGSNQPLTRIGTVMGTVAYMSPEQAVGQPVDARTDLYSLGIIFHEMLVGKVPFDAPEMAQVLAKQITEIPPPLPERVPAEVAALVLRLLEKSPGGRPRSAVEVVDAIRELQGLPASSRMGVAGGPVSIRTGRGPVSVRGVTVPAIQSPSSDTHVSRPGRRSLWFVAGGVAALVTVAILVYGSDGSQGSAAAAASRTATPSASAHVAARSSALASAAAPTASAPVTSSSAVSAPAASSTASNKTTSKTTVTRTKTPSGTVTTRQTSTKRQTVKKSSTTTKKKRRTGPGGIYIPPPSEWF